MAEIMQQQMRTSQVLGLIMDRLHRDSTRAATRQLIAPLIERASVSRALKDAALSVPPQGMLLEEVDEDDQAHAAVIFADLVEGGTVVVNARGAYQSATLPEPALDEALKESVAILSGAGWPEAEIAKISDVFANGEEDGDV